MQFTHEITVAAPAPWRDVWADWNNVHALPRLLSHVRATADGDTDELARFVIVLEGRHLEFAAERTMCAAQTLCWQSLGEMFLYVLTLRLQPAKESDKDGGTEITLTVAYDPPGFLPDIAESLGLSRRFKQTLEADLKGYVQTLEARLAPEMAR